MSRQAVSDAQLVASEAIRSVVFSEEGLAAMCNCVKTKHIVAGWGCCACRIYNGLQRSTCRSCTRERCHPLLPDINSGERFETYEEAYADAPDMLERVNMQLLMQP